MKRNKEDMAAFVLLLIVNIAALTLAIWVKRAYELAHPLMLWGLLAIPLISAWYLWRSRDRRQYIKISTLPVMIKSTRSWTLGLFKHMPFILCTAGTALLLLSMSRPRSQDQWKDVTREGIDIMVALDVSASMLAKDFRPDRLESSKEVAIDFIDARPSDRIGLVVYEGESFTQCPLTTDHMVLKDLFLKVRSGLMNGGTAIGMGLATAVNRLRDSEAKSKVVILLTDGVNNTGTVQPLDAAQIAKQFAVRVYTIGVGSKGRALSPVAVYPNGQYRYDYVQVEIDEATLRKISEITDGKYYRATDERSLQKIYHEIDQLEKTRIKVTEHSQKNEEYFRFVLAGCFLFAFGVMLDSTFLRSIP